MKVKDTWYTNDCENCVLVLKSKMYSNAPGFSLNHIHKCARNFSMENAHDEYFWLKIHLAHKSSIILAFQTYCFVPLSNTWEYKTIDSKFNSNKWFLGSIPILKLRPYFCPYSKCLFDWPFLIKFQVLLEHHEEHFGQARQEKEGC